MAFVYRYSTPAGTPRYVGIVKGNSLEDLYRRIKEHAAEGNFKGRVWVIEYIDNLTITDAELLEAHFIGIYSGDLYNIAKQHFGPITIEIKTVPEWKPLPEYARGCEKTKKNKTPYYFPYKRIQSFTCSCCGADVGHSPNIAEIKISPSGYRFPEAAAFWLCEDCLKRICISIKNLKNKYMKHGLSFVPYEGPVPRRVGPKVSFRRKSDA